MNTQLSKKRSYGRHQYGIKLFSVKLADFLNTSGPLSMKHPLSLSFFLSPGFTAFPLFATVCPERNPEVLPMPQLFNGNCNLRFYISFCSSEERTPRSCTARSFLVSVRFKFFAGAWKEYIEKKRKKGNGTRTFHAGNKNLSSSQKIKFQGGGLCARNVL